MTVLRRAVATIAGYVASDNMEVPDELRPASDVYAVACKEANARLAECSRLLKVNQRSEAIRQVEMEPDLLNLYGELAFKNNVRWRDITLAVGLTVPPRLDAEAARLLNEAYAAEGRVADLLREHRSLALARAPLRRRLEILRLLLRREPTNIVWQEDVQKHEAARFDEMRQAIDDPARRGDWDHVAALKEELDAGWVSPPPLDLRDAIVKAYDGIRHQRGAEELGQLTPLLRRAMHYEEVEEAERLLDKGRRVAQKYGIPDRAPLLHPLREAADWLPAARVELKTRARFEKTVDVLRSALRDGLDWWYVQEYYRAAMEFNRPLPADVAGRFAARVRRRRRMWVGGIVAAVLAAAGGAAYFLKS